MSSNVKKYIRKQSVQALQFSLDRVRELEEFFGKDCYKIPDLNAALIFTESGEENKVIYEGEYLLKIPLGGNIAWKILSENLFKRRYEAKNPEYPDASTETDSYTL